MRERPILFSGPMVRAILEGRKTQTRRVVKPSAKGCTVGFSMRGLIRWLFNRRPDGEPWSGISCPYGQPGDRLWVRETFGFSRQDDDVNGRERVVVYQAGYPYHITDAGSDQLKRCRDGSFMQPNHYVRSPNQWTPSIYMPRWASRLSLEIVSVRVERLNDISEADALAEGCDTDRLPDGAGEGGEWHCPTAWYADLWESINGAGSWAQNPWVWVVEFKVVTP